MSAGQDKVLSPEGLTPEQEILANNLFEIGAIKFGDFRLKLHDANPEAPLSPIFIDLRLLRRFTRAKDSAIDVYQRLVSPLTFDLFADVPTAATPLVSSLSDLFGIGMITPRSDNKSHGTGAKVDGLIPQDRGTIALLIDDLITRADSKIEAIRILESEGIVVNDVVVLIDREQGGKEELEKRGYNLVSAMKMQQMLDFYLRVGKINRGRYEDTVKRTQELNSFLSQT